MQLISRSSMIPFVSMMAIVIVASNVLVQFPFNYYGLGELLTWGAFTYPFAFLINDLTNRRFGTDAARRVVFIGFVLAVVLSVYFATPRIAIASGCAFLVSQLIDTGIFDKLRNSVWWLPPAISSLVGSIVDTALFFGLAFAPAFAGIDHAFGMEDGSLGFDVGIFGFAVPLWASLAIGDFFVKVLVGLLALVPYGGYLKLVETKTA